jgi:SAM-dependent methyltransferase
VTVSPGVRRGPAEVVAPGASAGAPGLGCDDARLPVELDKRPLALVPVRCSTCGDEDAEPIAVAEDFDFATSPDSFLALRCSGCGCVYMNPAPADAERERIFPPQYFAAAAPHPKDFRERLRRRRKSRVLARWCRALRPGGRILDVGCGPGLYLQVLRELGGDRWRLEGIDPADAAVRLARLTGVEVHHGKVEDQELPLDSYDLALLVHTLEEAPDPGATLGAVRAVLRPGGRAVIVVNNLASPSFRLFQGRHWGGYDLPRQRQLFTPEALRRLAQRSNLELLSLSTLASGGTWARSVRRLLQDWSAPAWSIRCFGHRSLLTAAAFGALDAVHQLRGRGALLAAMVRRPEGHG